MVKVFMPQSLKEALRIRKEEKAIPFAGGTDLMVKRGRLRGLAPYFEKPVLFLHRVKELTGVKFEEGRVRIGALSTLSEILENRDIPLILKYAIAEIASPAIRNLATIGGNICNASPAGDTLPPLYVMNARVVLSSFTSEREMKIMDFIKGPGSTDLKEEELLKEIIIPVEFFNIVFYRKVGTRKANSLSKVSFAGVARLDDGIIKDIRISFGAVAPTPLRAPEIEEEIIGKNKVKIIAKIPDILEKYARIIRPIDDQRSTARYRKTISLKILEYFLKEEIK
ncbi:MAG: FAD binding domain-containing protein [Candidatus Hydrothermae bacterium]|nr:FAD binding domain-containing protein [Candidatus Hydrothermae bacterium]